MAVAERITWWQVWTQNCVVFILASVSRPGSPEAERAAARRWEQRLRCGRSVRRCVTHRVWFFTKKQNDWLVSVVIANEEICDRDTTNIVWKKYFQLSENELVIKMSLLRFINSFRMRWEEFLEQSLSFGKFFNVLWQLLKMYSVTYSVDSRCKSWEKATVKVQAKVKMLLCSLSVTLPTENGEGGAADSSDDRCENASRCSRRSSHRLTLVSY